MRLLSVFFIVCCLCSCDYIKVSSPKSPDKTAVALQKLLTDNAITIRQLRNAAVELKMFRNAVTSVPKAVVYSGRPVDDLRAQQDCISALMVFLCKEKHALALHQEKKILKRRALLQKYLAILGNPARLPERTQKTSLSVGHDVIDALIEQQQKELLMLHLLLEPLRRTLVQANEVDILKLRNTITSFLTEHQLHLEMPCRIAPLEQLQKLSLTDRLEMQRSELQMLTEFFARCKADAKDAKK